MKSNKKKKKENKKESINGFEPGYEDPDETDLKEAKRRIEESKNRILILDKHLPWEDILLNSNNDKSKDILYVIFPSRRGGYSIQAVPLYPTCFEVRKPFPNQWAGLREKELREASGVETAEFCHNARFLCVCRELEDAIKLAKEAIER